MTLKLHVQKVIDEDIEISEREYITHLIRIVMGNNTDVDYNDPVAQYALADQVGRLFQTSIEMGSYLNKSDLTPPQYDERLGAKFGSRWWKDGKRIR